jgi:2-iminobutanoate/2-iminopropanoate deaminase
MKKVHTDKAPKAVGPYSQATISNDLVFCSGQIGLDPITNNLVGDDIVSQTEQTLKNLKAVLEQAGSSLNKSVKTTCYLKNISDYQKFNEIYEKYFIGKPARATIEVSNLPKGALVEIDVIAEIN